MLRRPSQYRKYDAEDYLRDADNRFLFNPESGIYEPKTSYKKKKAKKFKLLSLSLFQWGTLILSALTLFFLIKYTNYSRLQWKAAKGMAESAADSITKAQAAIDQSKTQFQANERPYIWTWIPNQPDGISDIPHVKLGEVVSWNFRYTNYGKSPAVGVAARCQLRLAAQKTPELKDMYAPIHKPGYEQEGVIVPPNDKTNWGTCFSKEKITQADLEIMNKYDGGIKMMVIFEYFDTGLNRYTSQVCNITRRPEAGSLTAPCPAENKIH